MRRDEGENRRERSQKRGKEREVRKRRGREKERETEKEILEGEKERRKEKRRKATVEKGGEEKNFPPLPYEHTRAHLGEKEEGRKESRARERGFTHNGREICRTTEKRER